MVNYFRFTGGGVMKHLLCRRANARSHHEVYSVPVTVTFAKLTSGCM
jgi:hypothetical protein